MTSYVDDYVDFYRDAYDFAGDFDDNPKSEFLGSSFSTYLQFLSK
jgi:hypothetical protein